MAPSDLPPLRPEYLPRPYPWLVDREAQDPNNPYNLIDRVQKLRELRQPDPAADSASKTDSPDDPMLGRSRKTLSERGITLDSGAQPIDRQRPDDTRRASEPTARPDSSAPQVVLPDDDLRDLVRLIALRQEFAPAAVQVETAAGNPVLSIRYAYSPTLEMRVRRALNLDKQKTRVLLFAVRSAVLTEFEPNFFVSQAGTTFRPEPDEPREIGFFLGSRGTQAAERLALGYLVVPARFDPEQTMDLWWNDRRTTAVLELGAESEAP